MTTANTDDQSGNKESLFTVGDRTYGAEEAKTKIENQDAFIEQLKAENEKMRDVVMKMDERLNTDASAVTKLDEVLNKLNQPSHETPVADQTDPLDKDALIAELLKQAEGKVTDTLKTHKQNEIKEENLLASKQAAVQAYGEDWEDSLVKKGRELGFTKEAVIDFMESNPVAFKELFTPKAPVPNPTPQSSSNPVGFKHSAQDTEIPQFTTQWLKEDRIAAQREAYKMVEERLKKQGII